jgi:hypothetical protein
MPLQPPVVPGQAPPRPAQRQLPQPPTSFAGGGSAAVGSGTMSPDQVARMQAMRMAFSRMGPAPAASAGPGGLISSPLFGGGKQGLVNYGGAVGANAEVLRNVNGGHVI